MARVSDVLAEADPVGVGGVERLVDLDHRAGGVDPALDEPELDPLGLREGQPEGEGLARLTDGRGARRRAASSIRLRVPISSSGPHRPQLRTRAATSANDGGNGHARTVPPARARPARPGVRLRLSAGPGRTILRARTRFARSLREGLPMTTTRAAVCTGLNEPWKTEEIEIDPPGNREVRVKMVWSGMCHSDEHLRTGDISQTPEVLEMMGVKSMFPVVGGHEGSGIVTEVGTNVTQVAEGDHVAVSFIPSCGTCHWCASGRQNLCDLGMMTLAGGMISDGTYRYHLGGENLNRMAQLGTFADEMVVPRELARADQPLGQHEGGRAHQLRHRHRASARPSTGPRSSRARRWSSPAAAASARAPFRAPASPGRATSSRSTRCPSSSRGPRRSAPPTPRPSLLDAQMMLPELTMGRNADVVILTPGVLQGRPHRRGLRAAVPRTPASW